MWYHTEYFHCPNTSPLLYQFNLSPPLKPKVWAYLFCQTWLGYWEAVYLFIHPHRRTVHICNYRNISVFHYGELLKPYCSVKWCMVYVQPTPLRDIWDYICNPQGNGSILIFWEQVGNESEEADRYLWLLRAEETFTFLLIVCLAFCNYPKGNGCTWHLVRPSQKEPVRISGPWGCS